MDRRTSKVNYSKINLNSTRLTLIEYARTIDATHLVTLNFHARYNRITAEAKLGRWFKFVNRRLFRKLRPERHQHIEFIAFPEEDASHHFHYHAVTRVPSSVEANFKNYGQSTWKRVVPTSTFHVRRIEDGPNDIEQTLLYVTKSPTANDVIHSAMFHP